VSEGGLTSVQVLKYISLQKAYNTAPSEAFHPTYPLSQTLADMLENVQYNWHSACQWRDTEWDENKVWEHFLSSASVSLTVRPFDLQVLHSHVCCCLKFILVGSWQHVGRRRPFQVLVGTPPIGADSVIVPQSRRLCVAHPLGIAGVVTRLDHKGACTEGAYISVGEMGLVVLTAKRETMRQIIWIWLFFKRY